MVEPLKLDLRQKWAPKLKKRSGYYLENCGIENIYFKHKYLVKEGHGFEVGHNTVMFKNAINCWMKNVVIENADNGITFKKTIFSEMKNVTLKGRAGHHGIKFSYASNCLLDSIYVNNDDTWIHAVTITHKSNGTVVSNVFGTSTVQTDFHRNSPFENL
jgi:hypothetical protein